MGPGVCSVRARGCQGPPGQGVGGRRTLNGQAQKSEAKAWHNYGAIALGMLEGLHPEPLKRFGQGLNPKPWAVGVYCDPIGSRNLQVWCI